MSNPLNRGTVNSTVSVTTSGSAIEDGSNATIKATVKNYTNSKPLAVVNVDANGDVISGSAVSLSNGADVAEGATTDSAVVGDNSGTVNAHLRGLDKILNDSWDSTNHWQKVSIQNTTLAITQSGTWGNYTEDIASTANPVGNAMVLVRADAPATVTSADGDNIAARGSNFGALYVTVLDAGGIPASFGGGGTGGGTYTEDDVAAFDPVGGALIVVRDDARGGLITSTNGDNIALRGTNAGEVYVKHVDAIKVTTNGTPLEVTGVLASSISGDITIVGKGQHDGLSSLAGNPILIGGISSTTPPASVSADGDLTQLWLTREGAVHVASSGDPIPVYDNNSSLTVDGTVAITNADLTTLASAIFAEDVASANADKGIQVLTVRKDSAAATAGTDGDYQPFATDSSGRLHVNVGNTVTVASHAVTNAGTFTAQIDGAALTSLQLIDDIIIADDAAFTPATTKVAMVGFEADESSTDSVDEGDAGAARMTLDRKQIVTVQPHTAGGMSTFNGTSSDGGTALTNTAQVLKASAGQVYGWYIYNPNTSAVFVQFYNTAQASVTVGTTNPLFMITVPPSAASNVPWPQGIEFTNTGFSCSATSTAGGNGAPTTALDAVIFYK